MGDVVFATKSLIASILCEYNSFIASVSWMRQLFVAFVAVAMNHGAKIGMLVANILTVLSDRTGIFSICDIFGPPRSG